MLTSLVVTLFHALASTVVGSLVLGASCTGAAWWFWSTDRAMSTETVGVVLDQGWSRCTIGFLDAEGRGRTFEEGGGRSGACTLAVGTRLEVRYDPEDPEDATTGGHGPTIAVVALFGPAGVLIPLAAVGRRLFSPEAVAAADAFEAEQARLARQRAAG